MESNILTVLDYNLELDSTYRALHYFAVEYGKLSAENAVKLHFLLDA